MAGKAELVIKFLVDANKAAQDIDKTATQFQRFEGTMSKLAKPAAVVTTALIAMGAVAVNAASDAQQAMGAVESVFGSAADTIKTYADSAATSVGLSKAEYMELAAVAGAAFINMGLSADEAAQQTDQLIGIGADLAATFGGTTADAVAALQAAFRGEADPAEKFGLNLKQSAINAKLAELGLDGLTGAAGDAARQQAIMALIMEGTSDVQGQFARETDTLAGAQQIASAQFKDAAAQLGTALLPAVTAVTTALSGMARWVSQNSTLVLVLGGVIGGLAVSILAINGALKIYHVTSTAVAAVQKVLAAQALATRVGLAALAVQQAAVTAASKLWAAGQWLVNAAMSANPIGLAIIAVAALVAGIIYLWKNCEGFRNVVLKVWTAVKNGAVTAWNGIKSVVSAVINWARSTITSAGNTINKIWTGIRNTASSVWNGIRSVVSTVVGAITSRVTAVRTTVTAVFNAARAVVSGVMNGIRSVVTSVISAVVSRFNSIRAAVTSVFNSVRSVATSALNAILSPVRAMQAAFNSVVGAVQSLISWIGRIKIPKIDLPFGLGSRSAVASMASPYAPAAGGPSPLAVGARTSLVDAMASLRGPRLSGGAVTVINVSGTLNDTDSARAVRRVLRRDSRRRGGVVIGATA